MKLIVFVMNKNLSYLSYGPWWDNNQFLCLVKMYVPIINSNIT